MEPKLKRAFSLIEIMQTVILLGIIAGLSISFFKKFDSSEKLYNATVVKLKDVIDEANRQMCNDPTPVCFENGSYEEWTDNCSTVYNGASYNPNTEQCEAKITDGACPSVVSGSACQVLTGSNTYINCDSLPDGAKFSPMEKINDTTCAAPRPCLSYQISYDGDINNQSNTSVLKALPISNAACPYNIPDYNVSVKKNDTSYSFFCVIMHDLMPHKRQGATEEEDLRNTCSNNSAFTSALNPATRTENLGYYVKNIVDAYSNNENTEVKNSLDKYSLRLPNGVTVYNLGGQMQEGSGIKNIFIKYDRVDSAKTAVYGTNMKAYRIYNPLVTSTNDDGETVFSSRGIGENGNYVLDEALEPTASGCETNSEGCDLPTHTTNGSTNSTISNSPEE